MAASATCPTCRASVAHDATWCALCFERFDSDAVPPPARAFQIGALPVQRSSGGHHATINWRTVRRWAAAWRIRQVWKPGRSLDLSSPVRPDRSPVGQATSPSGLDRSPARRPDARLDGRQLDAQPETGQRMTTGSDSTP